MSDTYRKKFPKGPDWEKPKPNPFNLESEPRIPESAYHGMEVVGVTIEKYNELKDKLGNVDYDNVLDKDTLIIASYKDMSREELEKFADRMRIDRNSFLINMQEVQGKLEKLVERVPSKYLIEEEDNG